MKVTIKNVKGNTFQVEVEESTTVSALKEQIESQMPEYPKASQTLVHKGKVLKDDTTVGDNSISEDGFVVVMAQAKKAAPAAASTPAAAQTSAAAPAAPAAAAPAPPPAPAAEAPVPMDATAAPPAAAPAAGGDVYASAASHLLSGGALESAVAQICDMGFPREEVMRAMRAAFNNPERAVEYLTMGMPAGAEAAAPAPAAGGAAAAAAAGIPAAAPGAPGAPAPAAGPTAQPFNMFGGPAPAAPGAAAAPAAAGPLDFLRSLPQFQHIRQAVQANPQILVPMLQEMGKSNPELLGLINSHQQEFLRLIMEQPSDQEVAQMQEAAAALGELMGGMGGGAVVELTAEDEEAVNRLQGLGFDRNLCIEAYLTCDKNENLAANYLFDNGGDM